VEEIKISKELASKILAIIEQSKTDAKFIEVAAVYMELQNKVNQKPIEEDK